MFFLGTWGPFLRKKGSLVFGRVLFFHLDLVVSTTNLKIMLTYPHEFGFIFRKEGWTSAKKKLFETWNTLFSNQLVSCFHQKWGGCFFPSTFDCLIPHPQPAEKEIVLCRRSRHFANHAKNKVYRIWWKQTRLHHLLLSGPRWKKCSNELVQTLGGNEEKEKRHTPKKRPVRKATRVQFSAPVQCVYCFFFSVFCFFPSGSPLVGQKLINTQTTRELNSQTRALKTKKSGKPQKKKRRKLI